MSELFANFEIKKESKWPTLLRLIGGSVVLHMAVIWLVVYVPAFRDALNVAALIAHTKFVDKAYNRTEIGGDVTLLELSNEKFHYPEGYWAVENQPRNAGLAVANGAGSDPFAPKIISRASDVKV